MIAFRVSVSRLASRCLLALSCLTGAGVASDVRDRLMGHAGRSVGARHYTAADLAVMAEAVARIALVWPVVEPGSVAVSGAVQDAGGGRPVVHVRHARAGLLVQQL